jgi:hypothetical protein
VNLGDKYAGGGGQWDKDDRADPNHLRSHGSGSGGTRGAYTGGKTYGLRPKSLIGIPWRYALRCIDDLGLILRAEVIWSKPNGLPESVTDRVRRSHEVWFHFVKQPRYYSAVDEIREAHTHGPGRVGTESGLYSLGSGRNDSTTHGSGGFVTAHPLGKLPGSVWVVPTQPLIVPPELGADHFAAFPMEWPRRIIKGWSPSGVCTACSEGRRPVTSSEKVGLRPMATGYTAIGGRDGQGSHNGGHAFGLHTITGYDCACPEPTAPTTPAVVLDPFGGTGTTALVADVLGRHGISCDLSADYLRIARWRTTDPGQRAAAAQVEKPPVQVAGQIGFDFEETA